VDQARRRLMLLNRVATGLMLGDAPQQQLQDALPAIAGELGAHTYFYHRTDDHEPGILTLVAASGLAEAEKAAIARIGFGEHLSGRVAQTRTPLILDSHHPCQDDPAAGGRIAPDARAWAVLPMLSHGYLFGTIALASTTQAGFAPDDVEFLKMLVDQFAAALDRARLEQRLRDSEHRYRGAVITGRLAAWETDMVTRTRIWTEEGMALFGLDLPDGRGQVGGDNDEFKRSLHPEDRYMVAEFHKTADKEDFYPAEYRIVRPDGTMLWVSGRGRVIARGPDGRAQRVANIVVDTTDRKKSEEHVQLLMRELSHRAKNLLAVVQAIAGQTVRTAGSLDAFEKRFAQRLQGLAASHDLLVHENWRGAPLADLARQQLAAFAEEGSYRLALSGPDVVLTASAAQTIGLALHELATNATKYGAWSAPAGQVTLDWAFDDQAGQPRLRLRWVESGGPRVERPTRRGFGHVVIENMVAQSVDGEVHADYDPKGLRWTLSIPVGNLVGGALK
jgi:two-component sensor histidine kinase/putative methionine-R-sulfoxide reductase with GAF domain